ncbi:MAG: peptidylprolyl isomerase [Parahaliea sp.]
MSMSSWSRLNRPWLHFLVIGSVLFELSRLAFPEPRPVIGPLTENRIVNLKEQWLLAAGRPPTAEELQAMIEQELDRDMLFQRALDMQLHLTDQVVYQRLLLNMNFLGLADEGKSDSALYRQALDMRLHLGDEVIKRRMVQVMERLILLANPPAAVTDEDLAADFALRREALKRPPRYSIKHIYFTRERKTEIPDIIKHIQKEQLSPQQALQYSSPFLSGYHFQQQTPDRLVRNFGVDFADELLALDLRSGIWVGPIVSTYGLHYVWIDAIETGRNVELDDVRAILERDLMMRHRNAALAAGIARLRQHYEVRQ